MPEPEPEKKKLLDPKGIKITMNIRAQMTDPSGVVPDDILEEICERIDAFEIEGWKVYVADAEVVA